ncbi:MAG: tRNA adenosine(34) deaminase TadA [Rickettsiella sp.]|nr:tRNA adenosine(34) deaminase TadA [Rickettsiella sp.]
MNQFDIDICFMQQALVCAKQSLTDGEVPVGAILVANDQAIVKTYNQTISHCDPTAHAEILALRQAAKQIANHRLLEATIYVTLEPCLMCIGAMIQARIKRLVFAAYDKQLSAEGSVFNILQIKGINHHFSITDGLLANESAEILKEFFQLCRDKGKSSKN